MLINNIFSFSHNVFKSLFLQIYENLGLFGKGLKFFFSLFSLQNCTNHMNRKYDIKPSELNNTKNNHPMKPNKADRPGGPVVRASIS